MGDRQRARESRPLPVFGNQRKIRADRFARRLYTHRSSLHQHAAVANRVESEQRAAELGSSRAHQSRESDDLTCTQREANIFEQRRAGEALDTEQFRSGWKRIAAVKRL